jgi:hypothetical protein
MTKELLSSKKLSAKQVTYFLKFHEILCIQFIIYLRLKCCFHFIKFIPCNSSEPRMCLMAKENILVNITRKYQ